MGEFSWTKADIGNTQVANVIYDAPFKFLIPAVYGGGFIKGHYEGYGIVHRGMDVYDVYELLAFWNPDALYKGRKVRDCLIFDGVFNPMKTVDKGTDYNRNIGIGIGCYDTQMDALQYPLKFVSASYRGTYEDTPARSYWDPHQGLYKMGWDEYHDCKGKYHMVRSIQPDDTVFAIENDYDGRRVVHFFGYGYCTDMGDEKDCRFVEYTGFYTPLDVVLNRGFAAVESEDGEHVKQYSTDCTFHDMMDMYYTYDNGKCPTMVSALTADLPNGTYVLVGDR